MYAILERERGHLCFAGAIADGSRGRGQGGMTPAPLPADLPTFPGGVDPARFELGDGRSRRRRGFDLILGLLFAPLILILEVILLALHWGLTMTSADRRKEHQLRGPSSPAIPGRGAP